MLCGKCDHALRITIEPVPDREVVSDTEAECDRYYCTVINEWMPITRKIRRCNRYQTKENHV